MVRVISIQNTMFLWVFKEMWTIVIGELTYIIMFSHIFGHFRVAISLITNIHPLIMNELKKFAINSGNW